MFSSLAGGGALNLYWNAADGTGEVEHLTESTNAQAGFSFSPDGRWMAYQSKEFGQDEVYVRPFPNVKDGRWQISTGGWCR